MFAHVGRPSVQDSPTHRPHPEVPQPRCGLEEGLQDRKRSLEVSFEAASQHLRMRSGVGSK
ncbi:hypothetical protein FV220_06310 [Methylobacterium sp. WL19]|nr:hypothetical protein FV220_06310 [Methylobacterium sp. WL19]